MLKKQNKLIVFLCVLLFLFSLSNLKAQETAKTRSYLIPYLQELETQFDVKFSYVDDVIRTLEISIPDAVNLEEILYYIEGKTQIKIQKLNDRYYALTESTTVDICGTVLDNFEQNTVAGATIEVLGTELSIITDFDGSFSLTNIPRNAKLQIRHIGFKTLFVEAEELLDSNPCATLLLGQFYQQLEEVVVYEFLTKGLVKQLDASIELNAEEFGILPGLSEPDILQTVQALPGIKSVDETVSDINIRGGSNDQNLILWDGIKMYQSGHFFGLISAFNPYLTDKVTLIKNGTSASYGDGVSGVIDMQTKDKIETDFYGGAGFNLISADFFGQLAVGDKLGFQFSARRSMTDFFNTPTFDTFFNRAFQSNKVVGGKTETTNIEREDRFYFYDFTGKILYDINENHKFRMSFININNLLDYTEIQPELDLTTTSELNQTNISFGSTLDSKWSDRLSTTANAYYTRYNLEALNVSSRGPQSILQNNEVIETSAKLSVNYKLNDALKWLNGYQFNQTGISNITEVKPPEFKIDSINIVTTNSLFSELVFESKDEKLFARAGVRLNYLENPGNFKEFILEPRLSLNYSITPKLKAIVLGEFKSQATNQKVDLEQNFLGIEKRRWIVSDGTILPISRSKQASFGLNYDTKKLYIGLEAFYKEVNDISTLTQGFQNQNQFKGEIGKYDVKGVEFLINRKTKTYSIWASYTYNVNNFTFETLVENPIFPNNLDIRHSATLAGTLTLNSLRFGLGLNYRSGRPFTEPIAENPVENTFFPAEIIYASPNSSRLPEYLRADASVIYDFDMGRNVKASLGASVLNFTNRKNVLNIFYRLDVNDLLETVESTSLGITPNFSFRIKF